MYILLAFKGFRGLINEKLPRAHLRWLAISDFFLSFGFLSTMNSIFGRWLPSLNTAGVVRFYGSVSFILLIRNFEGDSAPILKMTFKELRFLCLRELNQPTAILYRFKSLLHGGTHRDLWDFASDSNISLAIRIGSYWLIHNYN